MKTRAYLCRDVVAEAPYGHAVYSDQRLLGEGGRGGESGHVAVVSVASCVVYRLRSSAWGSEKRSIGRHVLHHARGMRLCAVHILVGMLPPAKWFRQGFLAILVVFSPRESVCNARFVIACACGTAFLGHSNVGRAAWCASCTACDGISLA